MEKAPKPATGKLISKAKVAYIDLDCLEPPFVDKLPPFYN